MGISPIGTSPPTELGRDVSETYVAIPIGIDLGGDGELNQT